MLFFIPLELLPYKLKVGDLLVVCLSGDFRSVAKLLLEQRAPLASVSYFFSRCIELASFSKRSACWSLVMTCFANLSNL